MYDFIYLCTVGTGAAGQYSNVAEGIMAAIRYAAPDMVVLMPGKTEDSLAVAQIVSEGIADICASVKIAPLADHDDLLLCRQDINRVIGTVEHAAKIVLNPTSGTKQMTTAAVLAAIDNNISLERIVDMRNYVFFYCLEQGESEEALAIIYCAVEACAKLRLKEMHVDCENLQIGSITGNPELKLDPPLNGLFL